ncbi:MAG: T9SS type A sorting domain-containing protein, partial [Saprospiraceae bacterium]
DANVGGIYGAEVAFDVKLKLFRALSALQPLEPLNPAEQSWYNTLALSPTGAFISFETSLKNAGALTDNEAEQAEQLNQQIKGLRDELEEITWYNLDGEMGEVITDPAQKALYDNKLAQLKTSTASLANLLQGQHQNLLNEWNSLNALNEGIGTLETVSAQNLKSANRLLMRRMSSNFSGYSAAEIQTLQDIAAQCAGTGGEAVFTARALLAETTLSLAEYNDECISNPGQQREAPKNIPSVAVSISPNPVDQLAIVSLPKSHKYTLLRVFDVFGQEIQRINISEGQLQANISTIEMPPGVYFLAPEPWIGEAIKFVVGR